MLESQAEDERETIELESATSAERPPTIKEAPGAPKIYSPYSIHIFALLAPASLLGVLARLGLNALATYDGQSIFTLAYAQGLGCFIMGYALTLKEPFGLFYGPLYTAITTGFCGSVTTFSGWQLDVFESWLNVNHNPHGGLRNFIDGLGKSVFTSVIALGSLIFGRRLARMHLPIKPPSMPPVYLRVTSDLISIAMYAVAIALYFVLPASYRHQATAALLFSYPGTLTRYLLAITTNNKYKNIPIGTLLANLIGTTLLGVFFVLQRLTDPVSNRACSVLQGLADGYCGCLTTVSTLAAETFVLGFWRGSRYLIISWVIGQLLLLLVLGPSLWGSGGHVLDQQTCNFQ